MAGLSLLLLLATFLCLPLSFLQFLSLLFFNSLCLSTHLVFQMVFVTDTITFATEGNDRNGKVGISEGRSYSGVGHTKMKNSSPSHAWGWLDWDSNPINFRLHKEEIWVDRVLRHVQLLIFVPFFNILVKYKK